MSSVRDTATFFAEGTASQFEHVLKLYPQALRLKAESHKSKKPEELIKLDNWSVLHQNFTIKTSMFYISITFSGYTAEQSPQERERERALRSEGTHTLAAMASCSHTTFLAAAAPEDRRLPS